MEPFSTLPSNRCRPPTGRVDRKVETAVAKVVGFVHHPSRIYLESFVIFRNFQVGGNDSVTVFVENRDLLNRFREGERAALSRVYRFYVNDIELQLRRWSASAGGISGLRNDYSLQQDVLQEIFIKAFSPNVRAAYDGIRPYRPYLVTIARSVLVDHLRKKSREIVLPFDTEEDERAVSRDMETDSSEADQEQSLHWQACLQASNAYVAALDETAREFVTLRFRKEMPQLEVAAALGISRWKVRSLEKRVQRGLEKYLSRMNLLS